jgi:predicted nuclease of predicted toxin-antitoxin system
MRILVDENIPNVTVHELRTAGHDVLDIRGSPQQGMFDDELWELAQRERRLLVTTDKGFTEYRDESHHGILVVRLRQPNEERIHARVMAAFRKFVEKDWPGLLVVMRDTVLSVKSGNNPSAEAEPEAPIE